MAKISAEKLGLPDGMLNGEIRAEMWGKTYVSLENCKKIRRFDEDIIEIEGKKGAVRIIGEKLRITGLSLGDMEIRGDIFAVENSEERR